MLDSLYHRGPDDRGTWTDANARVALGHTRLSILDLTAAGHEPLVVDDGRTALTFNGEIFNHLELRPALEKAGHRFRGHCDAETLAVALAARGLDVLDDLRGFFAFAAVLGGDVVLVRDRLGKKPLFYAADADRVVFASEVRALLASGLVTPALDPASLDAYLALGAVAAPGTLLRGVHSVPPGSHVTIGTQIGEPIRWWRPPDGVPDHPADPRPRDVQLEGHLRASIRDRLLADVPVGAFLSGGLDSPTIVALMQQESGTPVSTFTVGFDGDLGVPDERATAAHIARALHSDHQDVVVSRAEVPVVFDAFLDALDQPAGDAFNSFLASRAAAGRTTVVLSGVGADELLYGYAFWRRATRLGLARSRSPTSARARARVVAAVGGSQRLGRRGRLAKALAVAVAPASARVLLTATERRAVCRWPIDGPVESWLAGLAHGRDPARHSDMLAYLQPILLPDLDAMTMHHSLEARAPFLDHRLVEWALGVPGHECWDRHGGKAPLRALARRLLPAAVVDAPKRGFVLPYGAWLDGPLRSAADELAASAQARGLVDGERLRGWLHDARAGRRDGRSVWHLLVLEGWLQRHAPGLTSTGS
ncbi:MAG: hypothetical protein QOI95_3521 [Acidimicrobiaceae bacterium]